MILVFGGTTEGRAAAEELDDAGKPFLYSTKLPGQSLAARNAEQRSGAMTREEMEKLCRERDIRLLIDAAHPFAERLHQTVAAVSEAMGIPAIRFERHFPKEYDARIVWFSSLDNFVESFAESRYPITLLSTAGVQSVGKLLPLKDKGINTFFRILRRDTSISLATSQGATANELCFYGEESDEALFARLKPDIVLVKDSGSSGGFGEKVAAALALGIRVCAIRRPPTPPTMHTVNGPHGLRRAVESLLPGFFHLRSGLTTGTYATAAALAEATRQLRGATPKAVGVTLPDGETIAVDVFFAPGHAFTVKDAGDDPDVTQGMEIRARIEISENEPTTGDPESDIRIVGGEGIGVFTLPGFDFPPGEAAINRVPRQMIRQNIAEQLRPDRQITVEISAPAGAEIAQRTFNPRLGIEGGISIVGVSGIIKPFSEEGFVGSIRKCLEVAKASGAERVVINSGAKSEGFVRRLYPTLPRQAFVEYGNYIGETIKMAHALGFRSLTLGIMLGKAVKLAAGALDTHSRRTVMNRPFMAQLLREAGCEPTVIARADTITLARELWQIVPQTRLQHFASAVIAHCETHCRPLFPNGKLTILLLDEEGKEWGKLVNSE